MTGLPYFNFPAFEEAADLLRGCGWIVYSPRENDAEKGLEPDPEGRVIQSDDIKFKDLMKTDLWQVCDSNAVFVLPGYEYSAGAEIEVWVAHRLGVPVYSLLSGRLIEAPVVKPHEFSSKHITHAVTQYVGHVDDPEELELGKPGKRWLSGDLIHDISDRPSALDFGQSWRDTAESGLQKGRREAIFTTIPVYALVQEARVHGNSAVPKEGQAAKYGDVEPGVPNWSKGGPYSWMIDALFRHLLAFVAGKSFDSESGLHNLAHVRWMCATLMEWERRGVGVDDRLKGQYEGEEAA